MYGLLDNLANTNLELELPPEIFATSFNVELEKEEEEKDNSGYIFAKEFTCPVCRANFTSAVLRESKLRMLGTDELRPIYKDMEPLCYDVLMCVNCGYASLKDKFDVLSERQEEMLLTNIRANYTNFMPASYPLEIDLKMAVERNKYALLTAIIKKSSLGEKGTLLMKISWLYKIMGDTENAKLFTKYAYEYFSKAYSTERSPIFGMSEGTITFLLSRFATDLGEYDVALKFLSNIIVDKNMSERLRNLARDLKDEITELRK